MARFSQKEKLQRTIKIKILPNNYLPFMALCNRIYNEAVNVCFKFKIIDYKDLNDKLYHQIRKKYKFPSSVIQATFKRVIADLKSSLTKYFKKNKDKKFNKETIKYIFENKLIKKPFKKKFSSINLNNRNVSFNKNGQLSYSSFKRVKEFVKFPSYFNKKYTNKRLLSATVSFDSKKEQFFINLTFEILPDPLQLQEIKALGIDRGLNNIVYASDGSSIDSIKINRVKGRYQYNRSNLQAKGTRSAKKRLRFLSRKEKRFIEDTNHVISKQISELPYNVFVLENLKNIRKQKSKSKKFNKQIHSWSFFQLEQFIIYKCEDKGKVVIKVSPHYTSQECNKCGYVDKKNRNGSLFRCLKCGHAEHADFNASKNIRDRFLLNPKKFIKNIDKCFEKEVDVNQPNGLNSRVSSSSLLNKEKEVGTINCNLEITGQRL